MAAVRPAPPSPGFFFGLAPALALVCAALPLAAAAADRAPVLLATTGEAALELASGERISARLPQGAALEATASLAAGWLAAGTQPAGDAPGARDLLLLAGEGRTVSVLPAPPGRAAALRREPLPLVDDGRLAGLVWLEGEASTSFGVRFAAWNGAGWEAPQTIAPPGPGSQLALTAARLHDGSWLLAWSAYDGHDDEIVWSRGRNGMWSRPQRVTDNGVPDITPALTATGDGALLAWTRYDAALGQYRVVVSRLSGDRWMSAAPAGPPGSRFPTFEPASAGKVRMLYRIAAPQGWEVAEMDATGRIGRRAAVAGTERARPLVISNSDGEVAFRWPAAGTERTAAWKPEERKP